MKNILWIIALFMIPITREASAQSKQWTLADCINYAVTNNIGLQRQTLVRESAEATYLKSKMDLLPSLNFGSNGNLGFGRSINPVDNSIIFQQTLSNDYGLYSNLQIFNGLAGLNSLAANKFMVKAGIESEKIVRNTLVIDILGQYYLVLYDRGLENASKMQLSLSENQLFRITKMVETGKEALSKQYELESRVSADNLDYTIAQNRTNQAITTLKQMLQLEPGSQFDLLVPELANMIIPDGTYRTDSIYAMASEVLPRLKEIEFELKASKKQLAAARGLLSPSISGGGSAYTGYYEVMNQAGFVQPDFKTQLKSNMSQSIFLSLRIPIFNNYSNGKI